MPQYEDIDHDEEMAPPEVLEALPPRPLTQKELELILAPSAQAVPYAEEAG